MRMATIDNNNLIFDFLTRDKSRVWRHVLFILLFLPIAFGMSFSTLSGHVDELGGIVYLLGFCLALIPISLIYFNLKVLIPRYFTKNRYSRYAISFLLCVLLLVVITYLAKYLILSVHNIHAEFTVYVVLDGLSNFMLYSICAVSSSVTALLKQLDSDTHKIGDLENAWLKSSLDELKTRINPTFLYAVLDHASVMVKTNPGKASAMLMQLSELLRYELYDCKRERVLLKSDIQFIENYLSLVQQGADGKFTYVVTTNGKTDYFIPPFIFMPFIQEVMSQRLSKLSVGFESEEKSKNQPKISVGFESEEKWLRFTLIVDEADLSHANFQKMEQKLAMIYGDGFSIKRNDDSVEVSLEKL